jgi:hypothetical protein
MCGWMGRGHGFKLLGSSRNARVRDLADCRRMVVEHWACRDDMGLREQLRPRLGSPSTSSPPLDPRLGGAVGPREDL